MPRPTAGLCYGAVPGSEPLDPGLPHWYLNAPGARFQVVRENVDLAFDRRSGRANVGSCRRIRVCVETSELESGRIRAAQLHWQTRSDHSSVTNRAGAAASENTRFAARRGKLPRSERPYLATPRMRSTLRQESPLLEERCQHRRVQSRCTLSFLRRRLHLCRSNRPSRRLSNGYRALAQWITTRSVFSATRRLTWPD